MLRNSDLDVQFAARADGVMTMKPSENTTIALGAKVRLRGCRYGTPGTVIRMERGRAVVLWSDLDFLARHRPDSLIEAEANVTPAKHGEDSSLFEGE